MRKGRRRKEQINKLGMEEGTARRTGTTVLVGENSPLDSQRTGHFN